MTDQPIHQFYRYPPQHHHKDLPCHIGRLSCNVSNYWVMGMILVALVASATPPARYPLSCKSYRPHLSHTGLSLIPQPRGSYAQLFSAESNLQLKILPVGQRK